MSSKSVFSIINFESAPKRSVTRATMARPERPLGRPSKAASNTQRSRAAKPARSFTLAGAPYERVLLLLVVASFAAYIGAYLLGTALEIVGALLLPALAVALGGFVFIKLLEARRVQSGELRGYAAVVDPNRRLAGGGQ